MLCSENVNDIEDIIKKGDVTTNNGLLVRNDVLPKFRKGKRKNQESFDVREPVSDSIIPGTQKIYIKTWGCSHNNSDS